MATLKQKQAVKNVVENRGNVSRAMLDAGYSPKSAKNPKNLTESEGWRELLNSQLSDAKLLRKHNQLLNAKSENVQLGAMDIGYKLRARYADTPEAVRPITINIMNYSNNAPTKLTYGKQSGGE